MYFKDAEIKKVVAVLKGRFPNLTVEEVLDLSFAVLSAIDYAKDNDNE